MDSELENDDRGDICVELVCKGAVDRACIHSLDVYCVHLVWAVTYNAVCMNELDPNVEYHSICSKGGVMQVLKKGFSRHNRMAVSNDGKSLNVHLIHHILNHHAFRNHSHDVYQQLYWCLVC